MLDTKDESLLRMCSICAVVADLTVAGVAMDVACRGLSGYGGIPSGERCRGVGA